MGRKGRNGGDWGCSSSASVCAEPVAGNSVLHLPGAAGAAATPLLIINTLVAFGGCGRCVLFCLCGFLFLNMSPESSFLAGRVCICWLFLCTALRR